MAPSKHRKLFHWTHLNALLVAGALALIGAAPVLSALTVLVLADAASALEVGQKAPDFALNGTDGKPVKLSELTAKGPVVMYTFIAAFTPT
jgi:cytochrome oxidase Cu insertion factor (SCO1/SenC/PrrC family)